MTKEIYEFSGLQINVENYIETSLTNGEDAFIIFIKVHNQISKIRKINLLKATYVTNQSEQFEQDTWFYGYMSGEENLRANSFKKAGLIFYKSMLEKISDDDLLYFTIQLPNEGAEMNLCFQKTRNNWNLIHNEHIDTEIKRTPKQIEKSLLKKIERLEAFEEKFGVYFENISINIYDNDYFWFTVNCEVHSSHGTTIGNSLKIECILYNSEGSIINMENEDIDKDSFFVFEPVQIRFQQKDIIKEVNKIRLYPKKY